MNKTLMALLSLIFIGSAAHADNVVYGWEIGCQGAGVKLHITQSDDDVFMSSVGALEQDEDSMPVSTYDRNARVLKFDDGQGITLTVIRFSSGVGPGKALLKSPKLNATLGCEIGFVPYEGGPMCFGSAAADNKDCQ